MSPHQHINLILAHLLEDGTKLKILSEILGPSSKGQIKPKEDWRAIDPLKKERTKRICCFFAMTIWKYLKLEIEIKYFWTVKEKTQIRSFSFWENLRRANLLTVLSDL